VRSSVARRLGLQEAGLPPASRSVDGLVQVLLDATQNHKKPLSAGRLKGWHAALFPTGYSDLRKIRAGNWRGSEPMRVVSGPVGRERVHFEAPPGEVVPAMMAGYLRWWRTEAGLDGMLRAGLAHFYFVTIHPFEDGNGRLARALTDMALAQDEQLAMRYYSLSSQIMTERKGYYAVLERTSKNLNMDVTDWLVWFLGCFERAIRNSEKTIGNVTAKVDFWQQHAQTGLNERQKKVINRILDAGPSGFAGALTTRKYAGMTHASRATAFREISDLVAKRVLRQLPGKGRNVSYELIWPPA
jgi:Fic family protein